MDKFGRNKLIVLFNGAISSAAKTFIRKAIRKILNPQRIHVSLEVSANVLNPKIRGWINYYSKFFKWRMMRVFNYLDYLIQRWIANKHKLTSKAKTLEEFKRLRAERPAIFYHWKFGVNKIG